MSETPAITITASLAFDHLAKKRAVAADILRFFSFLGPDEIPWELVVQGASELGETISTHIRDLEGLQRELDAAADLSLISLNVDEQLCSMHPWVQRAVLSGMSDVVQRQWAAKVVSTINRALPPVEILTWPCYERLLPHARAAAAHIESLTIEDAGLLLNRFGRYLYERGSYSQAEEFNLHAVTFWQSALTAGTDASHLHLGISYYYLGATRYAMERFSDAERELLHALEHRRIQYGLTHQNVAEVLNQLGLTYHAQGKSDAADQCYQEALAIYEEDPGPDYRPTAMVQQNRASLLRDQERFDEAQNLFDKSRAVLERKLGSESPEVAANLYEAARLFEMIQQCDKAEQFYRRSLAISEKRLGPDHPQTIRAARALDGLQRGKQ